MSLNEQYVFDYRGLGSCLGPDKKDPKFDLYDLGDEWPAVPVFDPATHHGIHLRNREAYDPYCPVCTGKMR